MTQISVDIYHLLFALVRTALWGSPLAQENFASLDERQWNLLWRAASNQGVLAVTFRALLTLPASCQPPRKIKISWALSVEKVHERYQTQERALEEMIALFSKANLRFVVLKGFSLSLYYPNAQDRECGDIDIFTPDMAQSNHVMEQAGALLKGSYYKHGKLMFKGVIVENHEYCLEVRGRKSNQRSEQRFRAMMEETWEDTYLCSPQMNALFVVKHAQSHFLSECISLRQLCDWALLLAHEKDHLDWAMLQTDLKDGGVWRFAGAMTYLAIEYLGLDASFAERFCIEPRQGQRLLKDMLYSSDEMLNGTHFRVRVRQTVRHFKNAWKYHLMGSSALWSFLCLIWAHIRGLETIE